MSGPYKIILDQPVRVGEWVCEQLDGVYTPQDSYAIGLEKDGWLVAGVVYDHWNGKSVAMSVVITEPAAIHRRFVWVCFDYAFNQLGADKILGFVSSNNYSALNFDLKLGFAVEAVIKDGFPDGDMLVLSMTRENCRWLRLGERYGKEIQSSAAA